jgi:hypothetical protein
MTLRYARRCARCGAFLDPHEPVVVIVRDMGAGRTSPAALAALSGEDVSLFHESCPPAPVPNGRAKPSAGIES